MLLELEAGARRVPIAVGTSSLTRILTIPLVNFRDSRTVLSPYMEMPAASSYTRCCTR